MDKGGWFIDSHNGNIKEQYHFIEKIASGGFGVVYLAEHRKTSRSNSKMIFKLHRGEVRYQSYSEEKSEGLYDFSKRDQTPQSSGKLS